jgi:fatty acyl-CoA reductase
LAEQVIQKYQEDVPIAIARPAIVSPSIAEPCAGWIDNLNGPAGFSIVTSLGIGQVTDWNFDKQVDCFPVDFVANCLLAIARDLGEGQIKSTESIPVFNLVSTPLKPLDNYELLRQGKQLMEESPSIYVIRPPTLPPKICRMSRLEFRIKKFLYHIVFAYLVDFFLFMLGRKPM